jgi:hypothetical protein
MTKTPEERKKASIENLKKARDSLEKKRKEQKVLAGDGREVSPPVDPTNHITGNRGLTRRNLDLLREKRTPVGRLRTKLTHRKIPGYHTCIVNEGNVHKFLDADYRFVTKDDCPDWGEGHTSSDENPGDNVSRRVGTDRYGNKLTGFLMAIEDELWEEDKKLKEDQIKMRESGQIAGADVESSYNTNAAGKPLTRISTRQGVINQE